MRIAIPMLIPLGTLRKRLSELPKDKEIITFCAISLRGYEASLILRNAGTLCRLIAQDSRQSSHSARPWRRNLSLTQQGPNIHFLKADRERHVSAFEKLGSTYRRRRIGAGILGLRWYSRVPSFSPCIQAAFERTHFPDTVSS